MKTKKLLTLLSACLIALQSIPITSVNSVEETLKDNGTFTVESAIAERGDTVTLDVTLENNPGINALSLEPVYDTAVLRLESITPGAEVWSNCHIAQKYVWVNLGGDITDNGVVLSIEFTVLDSAPLGGTTVSLVYEGSDMSESTPSIDIISGTVTVDSVEAGHLKVGDGDFITGETVDIPVTLDNNPGICSAIITPVYDSSILKLVEIKLGEGIFADAVSEDRYVWTNYGNAFDDGVVCSLSFKVLDSAPHGDTVVSVIIDASNWAENIPDIVAVSGVSTIHNAENIVTDKAVPATCTNTGLTEGNHCSVCGKILAVQQPTPLIEHTLTTDNAVPATCTDTGLTEGSHCSVCGTVIIAQEVIPAFGHEITTVPAIPATCTMPGQTEGSHCARCGTIFSSKEIIPALGHTVMIDEAIPATCTETGLTEGSHCSRCNEVITARNIIPKADHKYGEWFIYKAPTCLIEGIEIRICGDCNISEQRTAPTSEHTFDRWQIYTSPSCTESGLECSSCTVCGESKLRPIAATGHDFDIEYTIDIEATTKAPGQMSRHCRNCSEITDITEIPIISNIKGDVNGDGTVDTKDLTRLMRYIAGFDVIAYDPDLNGDDNVDTKDMSRLMRFLAGFEVEFA